MKRMKLLFTLAIPVVLSQNVQAQTSSRLIAEAHWNYNGAMFRPSDSSSYSYLSSARGGDLNHPIKYDQRMVWSFLGDSAYHNSLNYLQEFDVNNNVTVSISQYWDGVMWINDQKSLFFYNTGNQQVRRVNQVWSSSSGWLNASQNLYSYNTAGKMYLDQYQTWNSLSSDFDASTVKTYFYDGMGNLVNETDKMFVSGTPLYTNQYEYTYSATNQVITSTYSYSSSGSITGFSNVNRYTNTYDTLDNRTTQLYQLYNSTTMAFENRDLHLYSDFMNHMPGTEILQTWDNTGSGAWVNDTRYTNAYNGADQLTSRTGISWNSAGFWDYALNDQMARFYYGSYLTSVKHVSGINGTASIYPNPAQNMVHVDIKWNEAQAATVYIYDMAGRVVRQWDAPNTANYNSAISVDDFAAGNYLVKISGKNGEIVKQIVIAH